MIEIFTTIPELLPGCGEVNGGGVVLVPLLSFFGQEPKKYY